MVRLVPREAHRLGPSEVEEPRASGNSLLNLYRENAFRRRLRLLGVQRSFDSVSASRSEADTPLRMTEMKVGTARTPPEIDTDFRIRPLPSSI
jgi:hypothetical protein